MAQVLKLKRTAVQGKSPTTDTLELGELAINTYDGKLYFEKDDNCYVNYNDNKYYITLKVRAIIISYDKQLYRINCIKKILTGRWENMKKEYKDNKVYTSTKSYNYINKKTKITASNERLLYLLS